MPASNWNITTNNIQIKRSQFKAAAVDFILQASNETLGGRWDTIETDQIIGPDWNVVVRMSDINRETDTLHPNQPSEGN